jgi:glutamyl-tRNA reductase
MTRNSAYALAALTIDRKAIALDRRTAFTTLADQLTVDLYAEAGRAGEEVVVLSTCERFEVYHANHAVATTALLHRSVPDEYRPITRTGIESLRHVFRVASGLESRIRGEPHVLGQVRSALEQARRHRTVHHLLSDVFAYAIRSGRRVREQANFGAPWANYAVRAADRVHAELDGIATRHLAIVGTGALARETARAAAQRGVGALTIVGRHEGRRTELASEFGAGSLSLETLRTTPTSFDAIVTAVTVARPVITTDTLSVCDTRLFVDLGSAPNVDPRVDALPGVRVVRLEDLVLGGSESSNVEAERAETVLERQLVRYLTARTARAQVRPSEARRAS